MAGIAPKEVLTALAQLSMDGPVFESADLAVQAALRQAIAQEKSMEYEYGGMVLQGPDGFRYTAPVTSKNREHVQYKLQIPKDYKPASLYHTHTREKDADKFSHKDLEQANRLKLPSYIHEMGTDEIRRIEGVRNNGTALPGIVIPGLTIKVPIASQVATLSDPAPIVAKP